MTRPAVPLISADEIAERLGVHRATVYRMVKKGEIPARLVGRQLRFDPDEVLESTRLRVGVTKEHAHERDETRKDLVGRHRVPVPSHGTDQALSEIGWSWEDAK